MIHESYYWKQPLLKSARWLETVLVDDESSERLLARAEREIFIGFYAVRKLLETFKLSTSTKLLTYDLTFFSAKESANPDYFNRDELEKHYDFDIENSHPRDIGFICNQVIHSYIFIFLLSESGHIAGIYLSSDRMKKSKLYFMPLKTISHLFKEVGNDYPSEINLERDQNTNQWTDINSK